MEGWEVRIRVRFPEKLTRFKFKHTRISYKWNSRLGEGQRNTILQNQWSSEEQKYVRTGEKKVCQSITLNQRHVWSRDPGIHKVKTSFIIIPRYHLPLHTHSVRTCQNKVFFQKLHDMWYQTRQHRSRYKNSTIFYWVRY